MPDPPPRGRLRSLTVKKLSFFNPCFAATHVVYSTLGLPRPSTNRSRTRAPRLFLSGCLRACYATKRPCSAPFVSAHPPRPAARDAEPERHLFSTSHAPNDPSALPGSPSSPRLLHSPSGINPPTTRRDSLPPSARSFPNSTARRH